MAFLLKYRANDYNLLNPVNGVYFTEDEVKKLINYKELSYYHILAHNSRFSRFILAYDADNINNISQINLLATRSYLRGRFPVDEYMYLMASMRINPLKFFNDHQSISFISGDALIGTTTELQKYSEQTDLTKY